MDIIKVLSELSNSDGVAGAERHTSEIAAGYLKEYFDEVVIDDLNNVIATTGEEANKKHLLLDAHIDEVGMIVNYITDDGFLKVSSCGGLDRRILTAQEVVVFGKKTIKGVVATLPPHLVTGGHDNTPELADIFIDIGYNKEDAQELVSLGDRAVFMHHTSQLLDNRLSGKALDDRAGVASILWALHLLRGKELPVRLSVLFSAQEEVGCAGAKVASYTISPDIAIAVDVSFALTPDDKPEKCGIMGDGVMIGVSPSLDRELSTALIETAKSDKIKYQIEPMGGKTSTNADYIAVTKGGVRTALLSVPIKYMHTPTELVDIDDIKATGELMANFIMRGCNEGGVI